MNEDRISFTPTLFDSAADSPCSPGRSLIQAWFIGAHSDIGGGPAADGLSLYPLQWVLIESKAFGLVLDHNPTGHAKGLIENPLALASLPVLQNQVSTGTPDGTDRQPSGPWKFVFTNGITIEMHDLRPIHNHGNLQSYRNKLRKGSKPVKDTHGSMWPWFKREKDGFRNPAIDPLVSSAEFLETNGESPADASPQHIVKVNQGLLSLKVPRQLFKKGNAGCLVGYSEEGEQYRWLYSLLASDQDLSYQFYDHTSFLVLPRGRVPAFWHRSSVETFYRRPRGFSSLKVTYEDP